MFAKYLESVFTNVWQMFGNQVGKCFSKLISNIWIFTKSYFLLIRILDYKDMDCMMWGLTRIMNITETVFSNTVLSCILWYGWQTHNCSPGFYQWYRYLCLASPIVVPSWVDKKSFHSFPRGMLASKPSDEQETLHCCW